MEATTNQAEDGKPLTEKQFPILGLVKIFPELRSFASEKDRLFGKWPGSYKVARFSKSKRKDKRLCLVLLMMFLVIIAGKNECTVIFHLFLDG